MNSIEHRRQMHVAQDGTRAGQWVICPAQKSCRIGGTHTSQADLKTAQDWAGKRAFVDLTMNDYIDFQKAKIAGNVESTKRPLETLEEKKKRLNVVSVKSTKLVSRSKAKLEAGILDKLEVPQNSLNDKKLKDKYSATVKPVAKEHITEVRTSGYLWESQWKPFMSVCRSKNVTIVGGKAVSGGSKLGFGRTLVSLQSIKLKGSYEDVRDVLRFMTECNNSDPVKGWTF